MLALFVALGDAGYSATGGTFLLGKSNTASTQTRLVATFAGPAFRIDNTSTAAAASGMKIVTNAARPPLAVSSSVKVENLNADKLDGLDSTELVRVFPLDAAKGKIFASQPFYTFLGSWTHVTFREGQRFFASFNTTAKTTGGSHDRLWVGVCWRSGTDTPQPIGLTQREDVPDVLAPVTISKSGLLYGHGGAVDMGLCVKQDQPALVVEHEFVTGWVAVVN